MADDPMRALEGERYINLETFRRNGTGVKTPVWFAHLGDVLVVFTDGTSYKVKRLRRDPRVRVAACGVAGAVKGPWFEGTGAIVDEPALEERAYAALLAKYGWQMRVTNLSSRLAGRMKRRRVLTLSL